ncbi:MAG: hypothetical protein UU93_C0037G0005 [Candidatus Amesbacteria bacterium GW2011_GWA2_42_12]|uniref:AAA+ ATPase domain-containing protein n=1 Tax=Candidatus Amesbacteria bacterium GW2011_GWA2_42_12 TaxID=1618356 RepID=A0A0G0Y0W1_9BACT|nr:MAG: hypothetical protein UU93_C0037G0005 [Candidatus Amesbacteria bacterium GW2011_GWA2_42_12]
MDEKEKKPSSPSTNDSKNTGKHTKKIEFHMQLNSRNGIFWFLMLLLFVPYIYSLATGSGSNIIPLSQLVNDVREEKVQHIKVTGQDITVDYKNGEKKVSRKEDAQNLVEVFKASDIDPSSVDTEIVTPSLLTTFFGFFANYILPALIIGFLILILMRKQMGGSDGIFAMGKSRAKLFNKGKQNIKFADVGGLKEAKRELEEIVDFLKNPKKYHDVGARVPKGVLLVGLSGTGKTMLARAVAGEASVPFLSMAGSEFMEMLVGVGASRARDLFETAKKSAPSIIFIDEIDVIVLAATNRGDLLDPALVRPGRFDRRVTLDLPDLEERKFILNIHAKNKPFVKDLDWSKIAKRTVGFSGADLENMLNEAAILIAREGRKEITTKDIEEAALKVKLGPEKKRLQSDLERKMTAYHEGGHAVLAHFLPDTDPVHRISIVSRGHALGFTMNPPEHDKYQQTQSELEDQIVVLLGGRTAEKLIFRELTGGASSDIERATRIARAMVVDYGMSPLGPINFGPLYENTDYGRAGFEPPKISEAMQSKIDREMAIIIDDAMKKAEMMLKKYIKKLDAVAEKLLDVETLEGDEFEAIMGANKTKSRLGVITKLPIGFFIIGHFAMPLFFLQLFQFFWGFLLFRLNPETQR